MTNLENRIAALSPAKRAMLEQKLREKTGRLEADPIRPRSSGGPAPASFSQQRLWFLDRLNPDSTAYNITRATSIEGPLDLSVLERSLTEIIQRHEALRTTFTNENGTLIQVIHNSCRLTLSAIDLTSVPDSNKQEQLLKAIKDEASRPFDLSTGPLFRATVLKLHTQRHVLVLGMHHAITDGWSLGILYSELSALYNAFANGESSPLSPLPVQYGDFALWQRQRLQGDFLAKELSYWREALHDLTTLDLPTDRPRPPMQKFTGAITRVQVPRTVVHKLRAITRQEGGTLFMTLLAAFQILLQRYSGQDDVVVGSPIAGRTRVELEGLIGFFVNMLVLRTDLSGDPTFRTLLKRVQNVAHSAYANQNIPFEKLVEYLQPARDRSRNPLFQVAFALQNMPRQSTAFAGLTTTPIGLEDAPSRFDLEAHFSETEDKLDGLIVYNSSLFERQTVERMMSHFGVLLSGIADNPDRPISEIPLLSEMEHQQQTIQWNDTATTYPREACVHELFEHQVKATPRALAVQYGKHRMTYRELNERSNQLAHYLRSRGVGPGILVGVCIERSIDMVVALLAVLKSGGAYVPLEPSYPRERLEFMLKDARAALVLTQEDLRSRLRDIETPIVNVDRRNFQSMSRQNPPAAVTARSLAYVMYTSGSTGTPKGVAIAHRAIVRLVTNTNYIQLERTDRVAQASNGAFDAATFEIWGPLLNGASLIGIPEDVLLSPRQFARAIRDQRITTVFLTTALFNEIANETPDAFRTLRYLLFGGQACDPKWVRRVLQHGRPQQLLHVYGPTESTTFATYHAVETVEDTAITVPIGRPIGNTTTYILDPNLQPVPVGVTGELYIGGDGLALEYWNRPELTSQKFIPDPFATHSSSRLYRTGDFARYRTDGFIEFIGRMDHQVKIRGFRIELQEIEAILSQHPAVEQTAVTAVQMEGGEKRLVAYFVSRGHAKPSSEVLGHFLREKVPAYMVPAVFIAVNSLPFTANGKVDYSALPSPASCAEKPSTIHVEPVTVIEVTLVEIWKEILRTERVGIHDDFFELGGHSLLAIQLIARIEKTLGRSLSVAVLFQFPTIAQLAVVLHGGTSAAPSSSLIPLQPRGSKTPFFWIHGEWSNALLAEYLGPDRPLYALEHQTHDGRAAEHTEVETIARYYLNEIRKVRAHGPYLLGGFCFGAVVALEIAQQLKKAGEPVSFVFMLDPPGVKTKVYDALPAENRLNKHLRALADGSFREKFEYVFKRVLDRFSTATRVITKRFVKISWKVHLILGNRLPVCLRSPYLIDMYKQALHLYTPRPYFGSVTIFKVLRGPYVGKWNWPRLIDGDLQILEHEGAHEDLRHEPQVRHWASRLKECIGQAEEAHSAPVPTSQTPNAYRETAATLIQ